MSADAVALAIPWTAWRPLAGAWTGRSLPEMPGLYRIRRIGAEDIDYIGQTGLRLRDRLGMLRAVFGSEMPYRDPHTVGPALWAIRHKSGCDFEVSVAPIDGDPPWRKALECVAIALYRQERGHSPTFNFGRMPPGYLMSSANNARLAQAGRRYRGGPCSTWLPSHAAGIAPVGLLVGDPTASGWCGHQWSPWAGASEAPRLIPRRSRGLYRLRTAGCHTLLYIGEGDIRARLASHVGKVSDLTHRQGEIFRRAGQLEVSWVTDDAWADHEQLELETDLIAAHLLTTGVVPTAQFMG